jgi:3',5'-cyclic AMP phosphodiesterase CpdA
VRVHRWLLLWLLPVLPACERPPAQDTAAQVTPASPRPAQGARAELRLPGRPGSLRFAVIGDSGRGTRYQHEVARRMEEFREVFPYDLVLMLGDNVYDGASPEDYRKKFEEPYAGLLRAGVEFRAVLGNHDEPRQHLYAPFNTGGRRYYTFKPGTARLVGPGVRFFMLDTENLDRAQLRWLRGELAASGSPWKIAVFHRPIFTSGRYALPARQLRAVLEPVLVRHGVSVVFSGHEHFYERIRPQRGITYFISGAAGSLRRGDVRKTLLTAAAFDDDYSFMLVEIAGDELFFQAITRTGATVDAGTVRRRD